MARLGITTFEMLPNSTHPQMQSFDGVSVFVGSNRVPRGIHVTWVCEMSELAAPVDWSVPEQEMQLTVDSCVQERCEMIGQRCGLHAGKKHALAFVVLFRSNALATLG